MDGLIRIGSRKSILARTQAYLVGSALAKNNPELKISYYFKESSGDKDLQTPLSKMPKKGIFTRDLQEDLINNKIDCIVHSWKDLDLEEREETDVISVLQREDQRDVLLFKSFLYQNPPDKLTFCTSSPRREFNLSQFFLSHLPKKLRNIPMEFYPIRGNIETRIRIFLEGEFSGVIIAKAALDRLLKIDSISAIPEDEKQEFSSVVNFIKSSLNKCLFCILPLSENPNAPAQGALAVEILKSSDSIKKLLLKIQDKSTNSNTLKERTILSKFGGGCHQKIGVSIQKFSFGEVCYLKGITDKGNSIKINDVLHEINDKYIDNIHNNSNLNENQKYLKNEIWPPGGVMASRKRNRISVKIPYNKDLLVSRGYSLPENIVIDPQEQLIWTAGISTWKELADRNLWVHGSFDSLGESSLDDLQFLMDRPLDFIKLTHSESREDTFFPTIYTYNIEDPVLPSNFNPETIKAVFWRSGSEFDYVTNKFPLLKTLPTFCGPGSTYRHLSEDPVIKTHNKLYIYLSFKDWLMKYTL